MYLNVILITVYTANKRVYIYVCIYIHTHILHTRTRTHTHTYTLILYIYKCSITRTYSAYHIRIRKSRKQRNDRHTSIISKVRIKNFIHYEDERRAGKKY